MQRVAVCIPTRWIAAPESIQHFLRGAEVEIVRLDLDVEQHDVDVIKKIKIDVHDVERQRHRARACQHAYRSNVVTAEYPHRRFLAAVAGGTSRPYLAVEKLLNVRQERDELVVVAFVEARNLSRVLVYRLLPGRRCAEFLQHLPRPLVARARRQHEAQRPQQDLPEVADLRCVGACNVRQRIRCERFRRHVFEYARGGGGLSPLATLAPSWTPDQFGTCSPTSEKCSTYGGCAKNGPTIARQAVNAGD